MTRERLLTGFGSGMVATVAMSIVMGAGLITGLSPLPAPVPKAVVVQLFGDGIVKPALMGLAVGLHLLYGGLCGAVYVRMVPDVSLANGLLFGVGLWALMQLFFLPFLGWGPFGTAVTPKIAPATLLPHIVYGIVLSWPLVQEERPLELVNPMRSG